MVFDVLAIDRASEVFKRVGDSAGEAGAKVEASTTHVSNAGSKIAAGLGIAAAAAAVMSVKMAADFQASTTRLVTSANETQGNLESVRKGLLDMAGQVGYSVDELATAMYKVESGGQHGAKGLEVLKAAAQGAKTENADLTTVADAVTSALADYGTKAGTAADITSKLVAATASGKMTFQELAGSMSAILPTASANHIAFNDILGDLASMTVHGMSAEQAAQNMADAIRHLTGSSQVSTKELALIGMTAQQVSSDLSTKGLSGTVQELSQAVLKHLGPGTSQVVLDLGTALTGLSPAVRDLGMKLMDGTISNAEYVKAAKALAPELQGQASQFATLAKSTHAIGNEQMTGSQVMTSYSAAMKALMGDATGMNVALMLTGDNTKTTTTAIENVTKATADASGNVRGWDLIQGNFNQKLDETKGHVQAMAIQFGQQLLPVLTSTLGYVNSTVLPGIEKLGSDAGAAAKWFSQLPGPVKEVAGALAGLALANSIGVFSTVEKGIGKIVSALGGLRGAVTSVSGLKSALGSVADFFGGTLVLGVAAGVAGIGAAVAASSKEIDNWAKMLEQGGNTAEQASAAMNDAHNRSILSAGSLSDAWGIVKGAFADGLSQIKGYSSAMDEASHKAQDWYNALSPSQKITEDLKVAQSNLNDAIAQTGANSDTSKFAAWEYKLALSDQKTAEQNLDVATRGANGALQDRISLQEQLSQAGVSLDQATLNSKQAIDQYKSSLKDSNLTEDARQQALDGVTQSIFGTMDAAKKKADAETAGLPQQVITNQEIVRQRDALDEVVKKLGFVPPALQGMYDSLNGPTAQALQAAKTNIDNAGTAMTTITNTDAPGMQKAFEDLAKAAGTTFPQAVTGGFLPAASGAQGAITHTGDLADTTGQKVGILGSIISGLPPSHDTKITADTSQATADIQAFLNKAQSLGFAAAVFPQLGNPVGSGSQTGGLIGLPPVHKATGGLISGPGTGTSDSIPALLSNGEYVVNAKATAQNLQTLHAMNSGTAVKYAEGGLVWMADLAQSVKNGMDSALNSAAAARSVASSAGGSERWRPDVDQVLRMLGISLSADNGVLSMIQAESGGNPNAINLTDSNARAGHPSQGLMQTIPGTFARWRNPGLPNNILDPLANIYAGVNYALHTYGAGMLMAGGNHGPGGKYIGYKDGTNYVPTDQFALLHKGEAVVPASRNQGAPFQGGGPVTLQLDGPATKALLQGHAVEVVADGFATLRSRMITNPS
jgi:hypothetical protein